MIQASVKSLGSGIGGVIVLTFFAATFLTLEKAVFIIPFFLAFTGAMTGFQLTDTLRERIRGRFVFPFVMGAGQGALVFVIAGIAISFSGVLLSAGHMAVYILVSGITSYLGARLAARYFNL